METEVKYKGYFTLEVITTPNGKREVLRSFNSVSILIYDVKRRRIILVRQPRAAMVTDENPEGLITETIAGRVDKEASIKQIIIDEAMEEAGFDLREDQIDLLNDGKPMAVSAGATNELCYLAFAEVDTEQIENEEKNRGVETEGEAIQRVYVCLDDLERYACEDVRVFALIQYLIKCVLLKALIEFNGKKQEKK